MVSEDILYVASSPKTGMRKYDGILQAAGISKADEIGLPAPRAIVKCEDKEFPENGYEVPFADTAFGEAISAYGTLRKGADKNGLWVDFEADCDTGRIIRSEVAGLESRGLLVPNVRKTYFFRVNGYYSREDSLLENIDSLTREENIGRVEDAVGRDRADAVYSMIDTFFGYSPEGHTNTQRVFGLGDDRLYFDLKGLLKEEVQGKYEGLEGSWIAGLPLVGPKYRGYRVGQIEKHRAKKEKQIDALRGRFSEPYQSMRLSNWRAEGHPSWVDAV